MTKTKVKFTDKKIHPTPTMDEIRSLYPEVSNTPKEVAKKTLEATVDTSWADVLYYDQTAGLQLTFAAKPGEFIEDLPLEKFEQLSRSGRENYSTTKNLHKFYLEEYGPELHDDRAWLNELYVGSQSDSATAQLAIIGGDPKKYRYWEDPNRLGRALRMGYKPCTDKDVITVGKLKDGTHKIMKLGVCELILLEIDKEKRDKLKLRDKVERLKKTYGKHARSEFEAPEMLNQSKLEEILNIKS